MNCQPPAKGAHHLNKKLFEPCWERLILAGLLGRTVHCKRGRISPTRSTTSYARDREFIYQTHVHRCP
jgi:hypothetical protein